MKVCLPDGSIIDLGGHEVPGADTGAAGGGFNPPRYSEIPQFIDTIRIYKHILGFDIPVHNPMPLTNFQCLAEITADAQHFCFVYPCFQIRKERNQQFHAYQDDPWFAIIAFNQLMIIDAHNIGIALDGFHHTDFPNCFSCNAPHQGLRIPALQTVAIGIGIDADDFDRRSGDYTITIPASTVNIAIGTRPEVFSQFPFRPN